MACIPNLHLKKSQVQSFVSSSVKVSYLVTFNGHSLFLMICISEAERIKKLSKRKGWWWGEPQLNSPLVMWLDKLHYEVAVKYLFACLALLFPPVFRGYG